MPTTLFGVDALDAMQIVLVVLVSALIGNYLYLRWSLKVRRETDLDGVEGFANPDGPDGDMIVLGNDHLYDEFYAKIYDKIIDGGKREESEVALTLGWAQTFRPETKTLAVLDVGCGTGGVVEKYKGKGVGKVVGVDISDAMVAAARKRVPKGDFRVGDISQIGMFAADEFNLVSLFYFTYYYLRDPDMMFKNVFHSLQPGGCLVIHLVNRDKFDPILESASPFVAFSVQKYAKERVTSSKVSFDKFDYEADFHHEGGQAEFREEFRFKNGKLRRQTHTLRIPTMDEVVAAAESHGFVYKQFIDLTAVGYEYQYLFCFVR